MNFILSHHAEEKIIQRQISLKILQEILNNPEQILEEEENLITTHRQHIDEVVSIVKDEMSLLNVVDKPGSDIEKYVEDLDKVLLNKISIISKLREQLLNFHKHLKTEEEMSTLHKSITAQEIEKST